MKYVTSDIHGRLDRLKRLIDLIQLSENDKPRRYNLWLRRK